MAKVLPEQVVQGLIDRGYSPAAAAGIAGNLEHESGFDTSIREINPATASARKQGGGFGLAQWTSADRKNGLYNMASMRGVPVDDLDLQLDYIDHELKTGYKKAYSALKSTDNPRQAAYYFSKHYEKPNAKYAHMDRRMSSAEKFFNMLNPVSSAYADETPWQEPGNDDDFDINEFNNWKAKSQKQPQNNDDDFDINEFNNWKANQPKEKTAGQYVGEVIRDTGGGLLKAGSDVANTLISAGDTYNDAVTGLGNWVFNTKGNHAITNKIAGEDDKENLSSIITGQKPKTARQKREEFVKKQLSDFGFDTESKSFSGGNLLGDVIIGGGTANILSNTAKSIPALTSLSVPIATGGIKGAQLAKDASKAAKLADMGKRIAGGAITGAASAGLVNPETAVTGGVVGAVLPPALNAAGKAGQLVGKSVKGKDVIPQATKDAAEKALGKGFVIPPSQVNPTLANRLIEGTAGKITTAQNASAKNQETMNMLARKAIGAESLDEAGIQAVRENANKAYDKLANYGTIKADDAFSSALDKAAARTEKFKADFPGLKNTDLDDLIASLKGKGSFNSDTTIEAIKRLREDSAANKIATDAAKKELGRAQAKIAGSLEDLVERNLEKSGKTALLESYRNARQTLAKTHSVAKAVDTSTGNINASKLVGEMQKGKLKEGELRDIAEFAQAFPKAAQNISKMGSLPQTSPLDVASVSTLSMMAGHPGYMALLALRPAARKAALSKFVQSGLIKKSARASNRMTPNGASQMLAKTLPLAISQSGKQ